MNKKTVLNILEKQKYHIEFENGHIIVRPKGENIVLEFIFFEKVGKERLLKEIILRSSVETDKLNQMATDLKSVFKVPVYDYRLNTLPTGRPQRKNKTDKTEGKPPEKKMSKTDYLICNNEYNSYNKTRGKINQVLADLEKKFRDSNFATSHKGSVAIVATSLFAAQMLKLEKAVREEGDDSADKMLKEFMDMFVCTEEGKKLVSEEMKTDQE